MVKVCLVRGGFGALSAWSQALWAHQQIVEEELPLLWALLCGTKSRLLARPSMQVSAQLSLTHLLEWNWGWLSEKYKEIIHIKQLFSCLDSYRETSGFTRQGGEADPNCRNTDQWAQAVSTTGKHSKLWWQLNKPVHSWNSKWQLHFLEGW